ncbi:putative alpha-galactosidase B [Lachnellula occidentalis]|uniref:Alpha-galactosidase n=1 Tax=Lachnellula occidentalis TaxID=215460 RepID=A0A8H8RSH0_9HELO|nr:putative alpha-galactosidase B [Lachnellula occidentalis]
MLVSIALTALAVLPSTNALVREDGVGKLPALGWNSWNAFSCGVDEDKIMTAANEIISLGLKDVGYNYVNIDDCWSIKNARDNVTGQIVPDPTKFPDGIKGTADKIHALGLKIGIYSSAGTETCAGYPASIGVEELDAATFASWGIDYLKYDNCYVPSNWTDQYVACVPDGTNGQVFANGTCPIANTTAPATYDWSTSNTAERYRIMRNALLAQNRTILYSLCEWGQAAVPTWGNSTGNSWRVTGDITPDWPRIAQILNENSFLLNAVDFWGHNDPDMLEIGNGALTLEENRSHFAFWAATKSPLIIGTALDALPADLLDILKNEYLLAFSQDGTFGKPAEPYKWGTNPDWTFDAEHPAEYWSGQSEKGTLVLALNTWNVTANREIVWSEVPHLEPKRRGRGGDAFQVTDIWTGEDLGCVQYAVNKSVNSHDTIGFLVGDGC